MRWLLISSYDNPGDAFIRIGVEQLIKDVDPSPHFNLIYKGFTEQWDLLEVMKPDKIVWCGMPFFWSFPTHNSQTIFWREPLLKKLYERKKDFLILGAGTAGLCAETKEKAFTNVDDIKMTLDEALEGSSSLTVRDDCLELYGINHGLTVLPCPAAYAHETATPISHDLVCNFMTDGGHYSELAPEISAAWNKELMYFASSLRVMGGYFSAHTSMEAELGKLHGFESTYDGPENLLNHLSGAKRYIGNRIHGAIVAASAGADSVCHGFDLRLRSVEVAGAKTHYFNCPTLPAATPHNLGEARQHYIKILQNFIST